MSTSLTRLASGFLALCVCVSGLAVHGQSPLEGPEAVFIGQNVLPKVAAAKSPEECGAAARELAGMLEDPVVAASGSLGRQIGASAILLAAKTEDAAVTSDVCQAIAEASLVRAQASAGGRDYAGALAEIEHCRSLLGPTKSLPDNTQRRLNQREKLLKGQAAAYARMKPLLEQAKTKPLDEPSLEKVFDALTGEMMDFTSAAFFIPGKRRAEFSKLIQLSLTPRGKLSSTDARELANWYVNLALSGENPRYEHLFNALESYTAALSSSVADSQEHRDISLRIADVERRLAALYKDGAPLAAEPDLLTDIKTYVMDEAPGDFTASASNGRTMRVAIGSKSIWGFGTVYGTYTRPILSGRIKGVPAIPEFDIYGNLGVLVEYDCAPLPNKRLYLYHRTTHMNVHAPDFDSPTPARGLNLCNYPTECIRIPNDCKFSVDLREHAPKGWTGKSRVAFLVQNIGTNVTFTCTLK